MKVIIYQPIYQLPIHDHQLKEFQITRNAFSATIPPTMQQTKLLQRVEDRSWSLLICLMTLLALSQSGFSILYGSQCYAMAGFSVRACWFLQFWQKALNPFDIYQYYTPPDPYLISTNIIPLPQLYLLRSHQLSSTKIVLIILQFRMEDQQPENIALNRIKLTTPANKLKMAASHHIQSFNFIYEEGLKRITNNLPPMELQNGEVQVEGKEVNFPFQKLRVSFESVVIGKPLRNDPTAKHLEIYPQDCRLAGRTYSAPLICEMIREIDNVTDKFTVTLGELPIMVGSEHCHLYGLSPQELIKQNEDETEYGGYFIINGNEKMIRMLLLQKKNYPVGFIRGSYSNRGAGYTQYAIQMRCVREDLFARTFTLHYINDGNIFLRLLYRKQEFLIPLIVILKALGDFTDLEIYRRLMKGGFNDSSRSDKIEVLIKSGKSIGYSTRQHCMSYLGNSFRYLLNIGLGYSDLQAGEVFLRENICVHLENNMDKFNMICLMVDKLYALVDGTIESDNLDSLSNQEILLPGHLYQMILREKLEQCLSGLRSKIIKDCSHGEQRKVRQSDYMKKTLEGNGITKQIQSFLSTGNLRSRTGLDLMQDKGFAVIADKLNNMRFLSHFRSVHRGAYFAEMKTTTVRKLLPESWGFLCPVHTPDGGPCGLLNHLALNAIPQAKDVYNPQIHPNFEKLCIQRGMISIRGLNYVQNTDSYPVIIEGRHVGYLPDDNVEDFVAAFRSDKVNEIVPKQTQIVWLKKTQPKNTAYPAIFISCSSARLLRPVKYLYENKVELISPLEQVYLEIESPASTHNQLSAGGILSVLAQHIPFLNYNQSPRNMYQCQMAKQTMGTAVINWDYRYDNKLYRILTSQVPLVKTVHYQDYGFHFYNSGCNAVIAVISYTGYDMEDAMIINKSSLERGFGNGVVYKTVEYQINKDDNKKNQKYKLFKDAPQEKKKDYRLPDGISKDDGIVKVGTRLKKTSVVLVLYDVAKEQFKQFKNKETETCYVDGIILTSYDTNTPDKILIKLKINRRPVIGDKFSSRHGQKGVLSTLWPQTDMPFTESGITPDVIINPNAFPSRMTIGMLIESMAGKAASLEGKIQEFEQFQVYEKDNINNYFGQKLLNMGYNYHGNQTMYSGVYGTQLQVDIYVGIVYYQRLRHMVSDKSQARAVGPVDILTQQPLKGRKKGGGIRMGEMERDAMLAHGISHILNERLFKSSDYSEAHVCNKCGTLIGCYMKQQKVGDSTHQVRYQSIPYCRGCKEENNCSKVAIPYVFKYLTNEFAAMNIKLSLKLKA